MKTNAAKVSRRTFLASASAVALGGRAGLAMAAPAGRKMRGIYPIAQTPCTPDNILDLRHLAAQVRFCTKARVPGVVWPQLASGWITLSDEERFAGAEAMLAAAKGTPTEVVIGVQAKGGRCRSIGALCQTCRGSWRQRSDRVGLATNRKSQRRRSDRLL